MFSDVSWPTVVGDDLKVPFSIATTPRSRERRYSFPWIASLTLDPNLIRLRWHQVPYFEF